VGRGTSWLIFRLIFTCRVSAGGWKLGKKSYIFKPVRDAVDAATIKDGIAERGWWGRKNDQSEKA